MSNTDPAPGFDGGSPERDSDQLSLEDTLTDRGIEDLLDEGYTVPERPRSNHFGETPWEESHGETLDQRLAEEEPDFGEGLEVGRRETDRAGRLVADPDALDGQVNDSYADDAGYAGGAASAEEAAMHVVEEP